MTTTAPTRHPWAGRMSAGAGGAGNRRLDPVAARKLWRRWIAANAIGELVGLGLTGALAGIAIITIEPRSPFLAVVAVVASGAVEGAVVGYAQWRVLRGALDVAARAWVVATVVGALAAWTAGVIPSQLAGGAGAGVEPPFALQLVLAMLLGAIAGPVLAAPQALVLRHHVPRAWRWIAANAGAWACALPLTFLAPSLLPQDASPVALGLSFALGALVAGVVAGAVHGAALVVLVGGRGVELVNPVVHRLLRGRVGRLLPSLLLLEFPGRRTGRSVSVAVGYASLPNAYVVVAADADSKRWWRNFTSPQAVDVWVHGRRRHAVGHLADGAEYEAAIAAYSTRYPRMKLRPEGATDGDRPVVVRIVARGYEDVRGVQTW